MVLLMVFSKKGAENGGGGAPALSQWQAREPPNQKASQVDLGTPWTITGRWVLQVRMSPTLSLIQHDRYVWSCSCWPEISLYLFYLARDLQGLPGCSLCPLGVSSSTPQGCFCSPGLVAGICNLLADVRESLHGLFSLCFSVFNLQIKLWNENKKTLPWRWKLTYNWRWKGLRPLRKIRVLIAPKGWESGKLWSWLFLVQEKVLNWQSTISLSWVPIFAKVNLQMNQKQVDSLKPKVSTQSLKP